MESLLNIAGQFIQLVTMILSIEENDYEDLQIIGSTSERRNKFSAEAEFHRGLNFKELTRFNYEEILEMVELFGFPEFIILENRSKI